MSFKLRTTPLKCWKGYERVPGTVSMTNHGKLSMCAEEDLPKVFTDIDGTEHRIEDIHTLRSS